MKIGEQDEILIRGPNVMNGYYNNPAATARVIDTEGYYHTGDVGYVDKDGHFYITDRLKDLFKLSNGKYVAAAGRESSETKPTHLAGGCRRLRPKAGRRADRARLGCPEGRDEEGRLLPGRQSRRTGARSRFRQTRQDDAVALTRELSDYERVKRVYLLPREFSIDKGEMTPTLKIKRSVIDEKYQDEIDDICR